MLIYHEKLRKVVSINGIFRPMILLEGLIVGIWKRRLKKGVVEIDCAYFM